MKLTDLIISAKSVGQHLILTEVRPAYEYRDGRRTDTITGYRYEVVMPERGYDHLAVRIDGEQLIELKDGTHEEVIFDALELFIYWLNGGYTVGARAAAIHIAHPQQKQAKAAQ